MPLIKISNGRVYDPANGIDGVVKDIFIRDGVVIDPPMEADVRPDREIDATGTIVMPGGVDMHCHIAGPKVNSARKMRPEDKRDAPKVMRTKFTRSGTTGSVPSTFATGYLYAGLGYTTAFDAAVPPLAARHVHEEFHDTPIIDKGFFVLMGNNHYVMRQIAAGEDERLRGYMSWLLGAAKGYAAKIVNPGGVEVWKEGGGNVNSIDSEVGDFGLSPRQLIHGVAKAANDIGLPHPVHIHCNNLGIPGNYKTTLETMKALDGQRGHITHIQFHSYGGDADDQGTFCSKVPELVEYVNEHKNISVDVGQVMFGKTTSMTGDGPLGYFLHNVFGAKWFSSDTEMEAGCGIVPIEYKDKSMVHALQWAIGLEWYLLIDDPWRVAMSTDHPNGGSFLAYPEIIALLMERSRREEVLNRVPPMVRDNCTLGEIDREYTLYEVAIITRAAPARMLGLKHKGHLGVGADGDVTIYQPDDDIQRMFEMPRYVIRRGEIIVDDSELRSDSEGSLIHVNPAYDDGVVPDIQEWFESNYTIRFRNYPVDVSYLHDNRVVDCDRTPDSE